MTQLSSLTVFSHTARETLVSEKVLYYNEAIKPEKSFSPASANSTRGNRVFVKTLPCFIRGKGESLCQPRSPLSGCLVREKGQKGRRCAARRPCPGPAELPADPPVPAGRAVPATAPAPLSPAPTPAALPAQLTAAGAEPPSRHSGGPGAERAARERKGRRHRAVRHPPWPLGGRLGPGAAPGAGSGGRWAMGPAQPGPAHAALRLKCRSQGSPVGMYISS